MLDPPRRSGSQTSQQTMRRWRKSSCGKGRKIGHWLTWTTSSVVYFFYHVLICRIPLTGRDLIARIDGAHDDTISIIDNMNRASGYYQRNDMKKKGAYQGVVSFASEISFLETSVEK